MVNRQAGVIENKQARKKQNPEKPKRMPRKEYYKQIGPFLTAHHPDCKEFKDDVYRFKGRRYCIGCFTSYPIMILILLLWGTGILQIWNIHSLQIGLFAGSFQFLTFMTKGRTKTTRIFIKMLLGIGFGFMFIGILDTPWPDHFKVSVLFNLYMISVLFAYLRSKSMMNTCAECRFKGDYSACKGMPAFASRKI